MAVTRNLLFLSSHLPSRHVPQAGQRIAYDHLVAYATNYNIFLLTFVNQEEMAHLTTELDEICRKVITVGVTTKDRVLSVLRHPLLPVRVAARVKPEFCAHLKQLLQEESFDHVHMEFTSAGYYSKMLSHIPVQVIVEHDVTYQSFQRKMEASSGFQRLLYSFEYHRQKKWELGVLGRVTQVRTLNAKDRDLLIQDAIEADKIVVAPPLVDSKFTHVDRSRACPGSVLLWGAMNRKENIDGALWFLQEILPVVQRSYPQCRVYVVGAKPPQKLLNMQCDSVVVTGFVDDPIPYFESAAVAVAPLRLGAGIKIKVLEFLAAGIPVVATDVAAEGIDGCTYIANDTRSFAEAVCHALGRYVNLHDTASMKP